MRAKGEVGGEAGPLARQRVPSELAAELVQVRPLEALRMRLVLSLPRALREHGRRAGVGAVGGGGGGDALALLAATRSRGLLHRLQQSLREAQPLVRAERALARSSARILVGVEHAAEGLEDVERRAEEGLVLEHLRNLRRQVPRTVRRADGRSGSGQRRRHLRLHAHTKPAHRV